MWVHSIGEELCSTAGRELMAKKNFKAEGSGDTV